MFFLYGAFNVQQQNQLVVEPTHSKNMRTSNWIISPGIRGENSKHIGNHHLAGAIYQPQLVNKPDYLNHQPPAPPHLFIHLEKSAKKTGQFSAHLKPPSFESVILAPKEGPRPRQARHLRVKVILWHQTQTMHYGQIAKNYIKSH